MHAMVEVQLSVPAHLINSINGPLITSSDDEAMGNYGQTGQSDQHTSTTNQHVQFV